jgi:serine protease Do
VGAVSVASSIDVERGMLEKPAGHHIPVMVRRGQVQKRLDLVLQSADQAGAAPADLVWQKLGARFTPVNADMVNQVNAQLHGGLVVTSVSNEGVAAKAGIQRGDILVGLHHWETLTVDNVAFVLNHPDLASFNPLCFYIIRSGQVRRGWFRQLD